MRTRLALVPTLLALCCVTAGAQNVVNWTEQPGPLGLGYPVPLPVNTPLPFDGFRSYAGLHARHQSLSQESELVSASLLGETRLGRSIWGYRLGTPSANTPEGLPKSAVMFAGTVHAREWQSPEVVTGLMELISASADDQHWLGYVTEHVTIVVVPVVNIDGFLQSQRYPASNWLGSDNRHSSWPRDGRMRRKNHRNADENLFTFADHRNGVDLNRNNPPFWGSPPETANPVDLTYRGPSVHSEPEILALRGAANMAPAGRLRFFADMHSYTRVFFSVFTANAQRSAIQTRLLSVLSRHHQALPGNKLYSESPSPVNRGLGTTSEYFGHQYQIPSMTWEIEPGESAGAEYGGFRSNGHDGFILPDSEIRRVRENLAQSMALSAYHMAGPAHVLRAEIHDLDSGVLVWSARWQLLSPSARELLDWQGTALVPERNYRLWIAFSKPMRWRDEGQIQPFPGMGPDTMLFSSRVLLGDVELNISQQPGEWLQSPGPAPHGHHRYRDDAVALDFKIPDSAANQQLIEQALLQGSRFNLEIAASDLSGHRLDANPATPLDFQNGTWINYEGEPTSVPNMGGADRQLSMALDQQAPAAETISAAHSGMWFNPGRDGEGWMLEILDSGRALGYWFTYDEEGQPRWMIGEGEVQGNHIDLLPLLAPFGARFGSGFDPEQVVRETVGRARLVFDSCDTGWFEYQAYGQQQTIALQRLTRTRGLDCQDQAGELVVDGQSGTWFDPSHDGEGYAVQVLEGHRALVMWFTYDEQGEQYWMIGEGNIDTAGQISIPELLATRGARFGNEYEPADVMLLPWGQLQLQLSCQQGSASYASPLPGFGNGSFQLQRLTTPAGLRCE